MRRCWESFGFFFFFFSASLDGVMAIDLNSYLTTANVCDGLLATSFIYDNTLRCIQILVIIKTYLKLSPKICILFFFLFFLLLCFL